MSSTSADFKTVNITDSRLHFDDQINYAVRGGAAAITSVTYPAQAKSLTSHSFNINIPSLNTVVSKRVLWKSTVVYKVSGKVALKDQWLFQYGRNLAPSCFPLHQSCITQTCQINSNTISINTRDVLLPLLRLNNKDIVNDLNSMSPNQFDNLAEYKDAYTDAKTPEYNAVLGDCRNSGEYWKPRGSFKLLAIGDDFSTGDVTGNYTPAAADAEDKTVYLKFQFTEPLMMLSPFTAFDSEGSGLYGIQNLTFNFTLESENCRAIRMADLGFTTGIPTVSVAGYLDSELQFEFLSPHDTTVLPSRCVSNYYEAPRYILASNTPIASDATVPVTFNTFSLNQIPDMIIIYARKKVADQKIFDTDVNLAIKGININFNNNSGLLSSYTPEQLYNITRKNNLNVDWEQFDGITHKYNPASDPAQLDDIGTIGSPIVLRFGNDIPLSSTALASGSLGQYSIQFNITLYNQTLNAITPEVVMIAVNSGLFVSYSGSSSIYSGILSKSDVLNCKMNEEPVSETDIRRLVGHGSFMDKLKKMPSSVVNFLKQHHKTLGSLAKQGLSQIDNPYANMGTKGLSMLGYGDGAGDSGGSRSGGALRRHTRK